jgi:hypothetical protein
VLAPVINATRLLKLKTDMKCYQTYLISSGFIDGAQSDYCSVNGNPLYSDTHSDHDVLR